MMIAPVAAALAEPTSAHMSDRRFLSGQGTSPPPGPRCRLHPPPIPPSWASPASPTLIRPPVSPSPPAHPTFLGITGVTNTHPPAYSASRPPIIADTRPTGYDSKPIAYAGSVQCLVSEALRPVHFSANEPPPAGALRIQASALSHSFWAGKGTPVLSGKVSVTAPGCRGLRRGRSIDGIQRNGGGEGLFVARYGRAQGTPEGLPHGFFITIRGPQAHPDRSGGLPTHRFSISSTHGGVASIRRPSSGSSCSILSFISHATWR